MPPRAPANIFLVGYMSAGKSSVGRALARRAGRPFVDTDALVAALARRSIPRVFEEEGEA
ncbi:MAG: shikimate kinase, partial [Elusimicrobia bacterium]|nr:shikimate kinase [Elusimicrobiota bacterium]